MWLKKVQKAWMLNAKWCFYAIVQISHEGEIQNRTISKPRHSSLNIFQWKTKCVFTESHQAEQVNVVVQKCVYLFIPSVPGCSSWPGWRPVGERLWEIQTPELSASTRRSAHQTNENDSSHLTWQNSNIQSSPWFLHICEKYCEYTVSVF